MKRTVLVTGLLLIFISAVNTNLNAQRGIGGGIDTTHFNRPGRDADYRHMREKVYHGDSLYARRFHDGFHPGQIHGNMRWDFPRHRYGKRNRMAAGQFDRMGMRYPGEERRRIESIPGLTEKQRTEIASLRQQQREDMKKFREETYKKMLAIREDHRNKLLGVLTDEQKKLIDSGPVNPDPVTPRAK